MKTHQINEGDEQRKKLQTVCVDISKASFTWATFDGRKGPNRNETLRSKGGCGRSFKQQRRQGFSGLQIVCESTGGYHKRLLRIARSEGCQTALVSAEQVKAMQVVESNDTGKSDCKGSAHHAPFSSIRKDAR